MIEGVAASRSKPQCGSGSEEVASAAAHADVRSAVGFNDVDGAQRAGAKGILVRTGKFRQDALEQSGVKPDLIVDSLADLPRKWGHS